MKKCIICNQSLSDNCFYFRKDRGKLRGECKECRGKYFKNWDSENRKRRNEISDKSQKKYKHKDKCRDILRRMFRYGKLRKRNICEICYASPTDCHHDDYTKPFEYIELCRKCHSLLHYQYREQGIVIT